MTRRRRLLLIAAAGTSGLVVVAGGWVYAAADTAGDVQVTAGDDVTCKDPASLKGRRIRSNVPVRPMLVVDERLDCQIPVVVTNSSRLTVTLTEMRWPSLAGPPSSGFGVEAVPGKGGQTQRGAPSWGAESDSILLFPGGLRVEEGESVVVWTRLVASTGDCVAGDLEIRFEKVPELTITALGRSHHRATQDGVLEWRGPRGESCGL